MAEPEAKAVVSESVLKKGKRAELAKKKALDARKKKDREIRNLSRVLQYLEAYETQDKEKLERERRSMEPQLNEVTQDFARFMAAFPRKDYNTCNNLLVQLKGKMKAESYTDPLLNNRAHEVEYVSNFAFLGITVAYSVMYSLYAAFFRMKGGSKWVMVGLHVWTTLLMLLLLWQMFIMSFIRLSVGTLKVVRLVMSGLLLVSVFLLFILLQLGLFQSLKDEF